MEILETLKVPALSVILIGVNCLAGIAIPLGMVLFIKKRKMKLAPFFVGCGTFVVFAMILESIFHKIVLGSPLGGSINNSAVFMAIYGGLAAGIFEETGRFTAFKIFSKKFGSDNKNVISYGLGYGGMEVVTIFTMTMISNLFLTFLLNTGNAAVTVSGAGEENAARVINQFLQLVNVKPYELVLALVERFSAVVFHVSASVLVWFSVKNKKWWLFPVAILLHALLDFMAAFLMSLSLNVFVVELVVILISAGTAVLAFSVWKKEA